MSNVAFTLIISFLLIFPTVVNAAIPSAKIELFSTLSASKPYRTLHVSEFAFVETLHFGRPSLNDEKYGVRMPLSLPPGEDERLCNEALGEADYTSTNSTIQSYSGTIMLAPRGGCTFERKVLSAQRLGADGVIIYNNLAAQYKLLSETNETETFDNIRWPYPKVHFECSNGRAWIPKNDLSFDPLPYNKDINDPILNGGVNDGNQCALRNEDGAESFENTCSSKRCLLTGTERNETDDDSVSMEACCAWDMHQYSGGDNTVDEKVTISAVFVTMEQGSLLLNEFQSKGSEIGLLMYRRYHPRINASSFILWFLGTFVTWLASWVSTKEYHETKKKIKTAVEEGRLFRTSDRTSVTTGAPNDDPDTQVSSFMEEETHDIGSVSDELSVPYEDQLSSNDEPGTQVNSFVQEESNGTGFVPDDRNISVAQGNTSDNASGRLKTERSRTSNSVLATANNNTPTLQQQNHIQTQSQLQQQQRHSQHESEQVAFVLTFRHAVIFLIAASAVLFILFFLKIYKVFTVMYSFGCSSAVSQVIFKPFYEFVVDKIPSMKFLKSPMCGNVKTCDLNELTWLEILSVLSGYALGMTWLWFGFTQDNPDSHPFYWVTQNIMGSCICIFFLSLMRLNSIKVATALLVAAFIYDIFFVFITPYIFDGESVMVTVATSGGAPSDPDFCEKYPTEGDCSGGNPLPMLLTIPRVNDYRGGMSLLGLGDIVLPGLLTSFAARLDSASNLVKYLTTIARAARQRAPHSQIDELSTNKSFFKWILSGYLTPLTIAYGVGLFFANLAVLLMKKGQPALLYLVPCCLGTMVLIGWRKEELQSLWDGPKSLKTASTVMNAVHARESRAANRSNNNSNTNNTSSYT